MVITKVTHYEREDTDFGGDYSDIELLDESGNIIAEFGDSYHDKGQEKAEGFIKGVEWLAGKKVELIILNIADREY